MTRAIIDERDALRRTVARQDRELAELRRTKRQHQRAILDELYSVMMRDGFPSDPIELNAWTDERLSE